MQAIPKAVIKLVAVLAIVALSVINILSNKAGTRTQLVLTTAKLSALVMIVIMGIVQLARGRSSSSLRGNLFEGSSRSPGNYALALYSGLFAFDGWDATNYVAGEMANVVRDLPRVIHGSVRLCFHPFCFRSFIALQMLIMVVFYIVVNIAYLIASLSQGDQLRV